MSEWRFVLSRQWAGYLALTVIFAIVCCALGTWQLNRRAEALAEVARIDANYDADPVPVAEALPDLAAFDVDQRWQVVALTGEFLVDEEVVVRNRPFEGSSGFEVITPFRLDDGTVFMVDRGWIAQNSQGRPSEAAPPLRAVRSRSPHASRPARTASPGAPRRASNSRPSTSTNSPSASMGPPTPARTACSCSPGPTSMSLRSPPRGRSATRGPTSRTRCSGTSSRCSAFIGLAWAANQERKGARRGIRRWIDETGAARAEATEAREARR